jgi:hypothetical protein
MLHFDREAVRPPHLVALDGSAGDAIHAGSRLHHRLPVLLVVAATVLAVLVDLVDTVPAWSPYAALTSAVVLAAHALLSRSR